jgi:integrase
MAMLARFLGLRASEIMALKWTDFDFDEGVVMIVRPRSAGGSQIR